MPRPDPPVVRVLREFRAALDAKESGVMDLMARRWLEIERRLEGDITALAFEVERRRAEGRVITEQIVWREQRYKYLKDQIEDQVRSFTGRAVDIVSAAQRENGQLGILAANEAIQASYSTISAIGPYWNRINVNALQSMIGFAGDGSPLNRLLKSAYPDALDGLMRALINGMTRGMNPAQVALEMTKGFGMGFERALLIARTEMARAYRTGSTEQYRQSGVVDGFYRLVKKETACMACLALDGQRFEAAEELHDHPRGKCIAVPQVMGVNKPKWETGLQWFRGLDAADQRERMGAEKYKLWQQGKIKLADLARVQHNETWGDAPRIATLAELGGNE